MTVHRATCSCSVELYKLWYTWADFFAKLGYFAGFFFNILFAGRNSEAAMGGAGVGEYNMISMKITELRTTLSRIFSKIGISEGFSLYNIGRGILNSISKSRWSPKGTHFVLGN
jgi:hypothetical protein